MTSCKRPSLILLAAFLLSTAARAVETRAVTIPFPRGGVARSA